MPINRELLLKIKQAILDEPKGFQMGGFKKQRIHSDSVCSDYGLAWEFPRCGTACCIAGYALTLSGKDPDREENVVSTAKDLLGINNGLVLFYVEDWPVDLKKRFLEAKTPEERALIGAERIDRFLLEASE